MSSSVVGINININGAQAKGAVDSLGKAFNNLEKALNKVERNTRKSTKSMNGLSDQGIANIQAGLVQLSTWLLNFSVKIDNVFDKMLNRFKKVENASTQLRIALGMPGATGAGLATMQKDFDRTEQLVQNLAATTQFTASEVFDALRSLTTAGFKPDEARKALAPVLKFVTASGGAIDLAEGIEVARYSVQTMGEDIGDLENSLNILARGTTKTALGFSDLREALGGVGSASTAFTKGDTGERLTSLFLLAAGQKAIGREARGAGDMVRQFSETINGLMGRVIAFEDRIEKQGKVGRYNVARQSMFKMLGIDDLSLNDINQRLEKIGESPLRFSKGIDKKVKAERSRAFLAKMLIGKRDQSGRIINKETTEIMELFIGQYKKIAEQQGEGIANAIFQKGFGTTAGAKVMKGLFKLLETSGEDSLGAIAKKLMNHNNYITKAQDESLKTLSARIKLAESAEDAFSNTIFKEDIMYSGALDTYTAVVTTLNEIAKENKNLSTGIAAGGRAMQATTKIGTNMGFMLTAMATFSIALNHAQKTTGRTITTLGGTMRAFHMQFLAPTLRVMFMMTGGVAVLSIAFLGLMKHLSDASSVGEGLSKIFGSLKAKAQAITGVIRLAFSDFGAGGVKEAMKTYDAYLAIQKEFDKKVGVTELDIGGITYQRSQIDETVQHLRNKLGPTAVSAIHKMNKGTLSGLIDFVSNIKRMFNTVSQVVSSAMEPVAMTMGVMFDALGFGLFVLTLPINLAIKFLNLFGSELSEVSVTLEIVGTVLGVFIAGFLAFKAVAFSVGLVRGAIGGLFGAITNLGVGSKRTAGIMKHLEHNQITNISVVDQLRIRIGMLNATKQQQKLLANELSHKYQNLSLTQQRLNNSTARLNTSFMSMTTNTGARLVQTGNSIQASYNNVSGSFHKVAYRMGALSGVMFLLNSQFLGGNSIVNGFATFLLILASIVPLLSAGFFTMAGSILAAVWPLLAVVSAITALVYIYKKFNQEKAKDLGKKQVGISGSTVGTASITSDFNDLSTTASMASSNVTPIASTVGSYATPSLATGGTINNKTTKTTTVNRMVVNYNTTAPMGDKRDQRKFSNAIKKGLENPMSDDRLGGVGI